MTLVYTRLNLQSERPLGATTTQVFALKDLDPNVTYTAEVLLSTPEDNLWKFATSDGRGVRKALEFMVPFVCDKKSWPKPKDVMYDDEWPMRQSSLLFAGVALQRPDYIELWKTLPADSPVEEVVRNFFIRQPVLWVN